MEIMILKGIDHDLTFPVEPMFYHCYSKIMKMEAEMLCNNKTESEKESILETFKRSKILSCYLIELSALATELVPFTPATIASMCVSIARNTFGIPSWVKLSFYNSLQMTHFFF